MSERPYTLTGDATIEQGVREVIAQAVAEVVARLRPDGILLSGSFARGEGGAYLRGTTLHLTSDVDLMAVYRGPASLPRAVLARRRAGRLATALSRALGTARVDLTTRPAALLHWPPATLEGYELVRCARPLHGHVRVAPPAAVRLDDLDQDEISRLLFKRGGLLLLAWVRLMTDRDTIQEDLAFSVRRETTKAILACGDSWLFRHNAYDHRLICRMERFRRLPAARLGSAARVREHFDRAAQAALLPAASVSRVRAEYLERWREAARLWLECWDEFESWRRETAELPVETHRDPLHVVQRLIPVARRLARRLPSTRELRRALPSLLASALARDSDPGISQVVAEPPVDAGKLLPLACRFLMAWHPSGTVRAATRPVLHPDAAAPVSPPATQRDQPVVETPTAPSGDTSKRTHMPATACPGITQTMA